MDKSQANPFRQPVFWLLVVLVIIVIWFWQRQSTVGPQGPTNGSSITVEEREQILGTLDNPGSVTGLTATQRQGVADSLGQGANRQDPLTETDRAQILNSLD